MFDLTNSEYFAMRAIEARSMAESADDPRSAEAHAEMAERYEALSEEFRIERPRMHIVVR